MNAACMALLFSVVLQVTQPGTQPGIAGGGLLVAQGSLSGDVSVTEPMDEESNTESDNFGRGLAIALTGMSIVAVALVLIIGFISALPRILGVMEAYFPEPPDHHARPTASHPESQMADDEAVLAAIGYVLHSRLKDNG